MEEIEKVEGTAKGMKYAQPKLVALDDNKGAEGGAGRLHVWTSSCIIQLFQWRSCWLTGNISRRFDCLRRHHGWLYGRACFQSSVDLF